MNKDLGETIQLGKTDVRVPPLGIGTWQWGDSMMWGYGKGYAEGEIQAAFDASMAAGITCFDTAEMYGFGKSERFLGRFIRADGQPVVVATKFFPMPWRLGKGSLLRALRGSLKRLGMQQVDLYQIHFPLPPVSIETWMDGLADAVQAGLTRAVGVSNYSVEQTRRAHAALAKRDVRSFSRQRSMREESSGSMPSSVARLCSSVTVAYVRPESCAARHTSAADDLAASCTSTASSAFSWRGVRLNPLASMVPTRYTAHIAISQYQPARE